MRISFLVISSACSRFMMKSKNRSNPSGGYSLYSSIFCDDHPSWFMLDTALYRTRCISLSIWVLNLASSLTLVAVALPASPIALAFTVINSCTILAYSSLVTSFSCLVPPSLLYKMVQSSKYYFKEVTDLFPQGCKLTHLIIYIAKIINLSNIYIKP